jgi:hypothetical protein
MNKKHKTLLIAFCPIIVAIITFLFIAFIRWDFNVSTMRNEDRGIITFFYILLSSGTCAIMSLIPISEK